MIPERLRQGDEIRVIAPSRSLGIVKGEQRRLAEERLAGMGYKVTYGKTALDHDEFYSNTAENRAADIHEAFMDPKVKAVLAAVGGYNANQLLSRLDFGIIRNNPKVFIGYGDQTVLNLAIYQKTGLVTYNGPDFSVFGMKSGNEYTNEYFLKAISGEGYTVEPSGTWSEDSWLTEEKDRSWRINKGFSILREGEAEGRVLAGSLSAIQLLKGTGYMPSLSHSILFIEEDAESHPLQFDRQLQSLLHHPEASGIKGLVIGRFQEEAGMTDYALEQIIRSKKELEGIPVIYNMNFGHVHPFATIPVGYRGRIMARGGKTKIEILPQD